MNRTFGEKLKNLRENLNITQTELGKKLHMTQRKISYLEAGKYEPSLEDIKVFCLFFKVSADYFLSLPKNLPYISE